MSSCFGTTGGGHRRRNAIQQDPRFGEARYRLAETYARLGDVQNAFEEYIRAGDLLPDQLDVQLKAAAALLLAGRIEEAKTRAAAVLEIDPTNLAAQILLGNALAGLQDLDGAIAQIEDAIAIDPRRTLTYTNLGALQLVRGDLEQAEATFKRAVELAAESITARLSLANLYWATTRLDEAERSLHAAVALDPGDPHANRSIATFYVATDRAVEAEPYLKALADTSADLGARLMLADYYREMDRLSEALALLEEIANETGSSAAKTRLAMVVYDTQPDRAHRILDETLAEHPTDAGALVIKGRLLLGEGKVDDALDYARASVAADPEWAASHYTLGAVYATRNATADAYRAFNEVLRLSPRAVPAQLELSLLHLIDGEFEIAVQLAGAAVKNQPTSAAAHLLLARGLMARGDLAGAQAELDLLLANLPESPEVHTEAGQLQRLKAETSAAARSFRRALELDPDSMEALAGLVSLNIEAGQVVDARARVDAQLARRPNDPALLMLAAGTYASDRDLVQTEQVLARAIDVAPSAPQPYVSLAQLYMAQERLDEAKSEYEKLARLRPDSAGPPTMVGVILHLQNNTDEARQWYERVLDIDQRAPVAANNLAWIYAESGDNLDVALSLAQTAKEQLPEAAEVNDTLGWIYYKKDLASLAIPLFQQSRAAEPENPTFHYHLGLAYAHAKDTVRAQEALEQALELQQDFDGAVAARRLLAELRSERLGAEQ